MVNPKHDLVLTREFSVPRETVWEAWTYPQILAKWWGPNGVTNPICDVDVRPGGNIHIVMLAGKELGDLAGNRWPMKGEFKVIQKPEKIVFTSMAIMNDKPILENLVIVTFAGDNGKTKLSVRIEVTKSTPEAEGPLRGMETGWNQQLDKLVKLLAEK